MLTDSIVEITTPDGNTVTDKEQIKDFCSNCKSSLVNELQEEISKIRVQAQMKPLIIKATEEEIKKGVPTKYEVPVTFDSSNFFG